MRQKHPSKLAHFDGNRASRRSLATRAQSGLCRPICADYSAHKLHARCDLHRGCMRLAGICWIAPGKPPPAAYVCGTVLIVRSDRDYNSGRAPRAAVWHETRTRAAGMHAEYDWPCYAAQLRRCPRVSARLGVPPGLLLCRQPENLSVGLVSRRFRCDGGAPHQCAPLRSPGLLPLP